MAFTCIFEGMLISEGKIENAVRVGAVESDLSFKFGAQLKTLRDVKQDMVTKAKAMGANAIENFTYGQKSRWLAIDDVAFWGKGVAVCVPQEMIDKHTP